MSATTQKEKSQVGTAHITAAPVNEKREGIAADNGDPGSRGGSTPPTASKNDETKDRTMTNNTIEIEDTNGTTTKKAIVFVNGDNDFDVVFGRVISGEFVPSMSKPSKNYTTPKGAHNAAVRWVYR